MLFKEPTTAPVEQLQDAISNGSFGNLNVSKVNLLSSGEFSSDVIHCRKARRMVVLCANGL